ncbi:nucleoporin-like protein 2 [Varroa jacobsoni]|uniref:nucleoporin-like protein 2 n=1 Tax=Varroa jacobsoni TaxID=62625 RepID=UPI000BF80EAD|nr:nucleoporin-like protein 2 [Varroa jacobsoni]XP_022694425.1 nucleoporin-like protein 2 [Varroa jacobsoni]
MTVCRYFQNGNCRYGQNCRFEHVYESNHGGSRYRGGGTNYASYHYSNPQYQSSTARTSGYHQGESSFNFGQAALDVAANKSQEINQVKQDLLDMLEGRFYPFSGIPGATNLVNFAHLSDLSPEEIRLKAYESLAANNFQEYQAEMTRHLNHVMQILRQLISNPQLIQESQARPIAGPVVHNTSTILNQGVPSSVSSLFQPHNSPAVFPQPGFGVPQTQGLSSVGDLGAGLEYNNPFAQTGNPFSQHSTSSHIPEQHTIQGHLGNSMQIPAFVSKPFASPSVVPYGATGTPGQLGVSNPSNKQQKDTIYTPMELLSESDLAAFRDRTFTLESLPSVAPPRELCD